MRVGEFARQAGVTVRTLHYYEEIGLLPVVPRDGSYRCYDPEWLPWMQYIKAASALGFTLTELLELRPVRHVPQAERCRQSLGHIQRKRATLQAELQVLQQRLEQLDALEAGVIAHQQSHP
jgi:MerR family transcriptional regulator, copper efflux regulator